MELTLWIGDGKIDNMEKERRWVVKWVMLTHREKMSGRS